MNRIKIINKAGYLLSTIVITALMIIPVGVMIRGSVLAIAGMNGDLEDWAITFFLLASVAGLLSLLVWYYAIPTILSEEGLTQLEVDERVHYWSEGVNRLLGRGIRFGFVFWAIVFTGTGAWSYLSATFVVVGLTNWWSFLFERGARDAINWGPSELLGCLTHKVSKGKKAR